jgi:hypothetical protein
VAFTDSDRVNGTIDKSDWLAAGQCLSMAWFGLRATSITPSEPELFRMKQGQEVGVLARELYPNGILVSQGHGKSAAVVAQDFIADASIETLFEATFSAGPFVTKADILTRLAGEWHVLEVKSSFSDTNNIGDLVDDLAYTVMILKRAGLQIAKTSLVLLSRTFRFGEGPDRLFDIHDMTAEANARVHELEGVADSIALAFLDDAQPTPKLVSACRNCTFFQNECLGSGLAHTIFEIPGLHHTKLRRLSAAGIIDLSLAPEDLNLNERQERAKSASLSGKMIVDSGLSADLATIEWPCYYLDFETIATFLPVYKEHGCHEQVLAQFSVHRRESIDDDPRHNAYLADTTRDCERGLAEALIEILENQGSIIVYSNFEETRIKKLRDAFPDLAERLQAILDRLKDLRRIIEDNVYHPDFLGSFSIKKVLPALVPDLSYAGLNVADGHTAMTRLARMARGNIPSDAIETTRQQLLDYCKMDTLAMVRLHETLCQLVAGRGLAGGV